MLKAILILQIFGYWTSSRYNFWLMKELIKLANTDSQELQETTQVKSQGVGTFKKYLEFYIFSESTNSLALRMSCFLPFLQISDNLMSSLDIFDTFLLCLNGHTGHLSTPLPLFMSTWLLNDPQLKLRRATSKSIGKCNYRPWIEFSMAEEFWNGWICRCSLVTKVAALAR